MTDNPDVKMNRRHAVGVLGGIAASFTFLGCEARGDEGTGSAIDRAARNQPGNDVIEVFSGLDLLTRDTMAGVISFIAPGWDLYSAVQRVWMAEPGGMAAEADHYLTLYLNKYIPVPPLVQTAVNAMMPQLSTIPLPASVISALPLALRATVTNYGALLTAGLGANNATLPLAPFIAALLNWLAITVRPSSIAGPFLTPFPRLTWQEKGEVWRRFEIFVPDYFSPGSATSILPVAQYPDVVRTLPGLLDYASGAVLEIGAMGCYCEWHVFDYATRRPFARPVGHLLSNYKGPAEGWDEFRGYYQGRRSAVDA